MDQKSVRQPLRNAAAILALATLFLVGFGDDLLKQVNYWRFRAVESRIGVAFLNNEKLVSEKVYETEEGETQRLFVYESNSAHKSRKTCRILLTDANYRVLSSWDRDNSGELISIGLMTTVSPPVVEVVHRNEKQEVLCEHLCMHQGVLHPYSFRKKLAVSFNLHN